MIRFLTTAFLLLFAGLRVHSQVADVFGGRGLQPVARYQQVFLDSTGKYTPEELATPAMMARFRPIGGDYENLDIRKEVVWLYMKVVQHSDDHYFINSTQPLTNDVRFYRKTATGWKEYRSGVDLPAENRFVKSNFLVFPLEQQQGDTGTYFVRISSYFPVLISTKIGTETDFWESQFNDSIFAGVFFGIMLVMALYNLFLFLTNRDRVYIYYVLYVLFSVIFISFTNGYIVSFPDFFRTIFIHSHVLFPVLFGYFGVLFTIRFLNTRKYAPRLHTTLYVLMFLTTGVVAAGFFVPHLSTFFIQLIGILLSVFSLATGFTVYRKGYAPSRYYLLGFGIYMLGLATYIVLAFVDVDTGAFTPQRILMGSSAIEAIILSFAIGDKLNIAVHDKQAAQEKTLEAVRENERIVREQNAELEKKVAARTSEIQHQKGIIEEKNKDILDSIYYARRIQRALLASDKMLEKNLPEHFVLYRPKDIVSGDFYWASETPDDTFLLLTGDCTGHGVPGAFMSLLHISILHELTNVLKLAQPDELLNKQRDAIIMALNPEGSAEISKDGMDCVLCSFDFKNNKLSFACANNPLWIMRNGEMIDYRPDKIPVGMHEGETKNFTLHEVNLLPGDVVYTFTDGFADQFGGPKGKKFKYTQLKEKLKGLSALPMNKQKAALEKVFDDWKGELEQLDDMLVVGVRV